MRSRKSQSNNWFDVWNRKSRLRSGTRLLASFLDPSDELSTFANSGTGSKNMGRSSKKKGHLNNDGKSRNGSKVKGGIDSGPHESVNSNKGLGVWDRVMEKDPQHHDDIKMDEECKPSLDSLSVPRKVFESKASSNFSMDKEQPQIIEVDADVEHKPAILKSSNDDDENVDLEYKKFLDHLVVDKMSYRVEFIINGSPLILKYEEKGYSSHVIQAKPVVSDTLVSKKGCHKNYSENTTLRQEFDQNTTPRHQYSRTKKTIDSLVDEDYEIFLTYLREDDGLMMLKMDNEVIRYEMESEYEDEVEILTNEKCFSEMFVMSKKMMSVAHTSFPHPSDGPLDMNLDHDTSHPFSSHACEADSSTCSLCEVLPFKDRLNNLLRRPFDQNEYNDLLKKATIRLPLMKYKHLRGQSIPYMTKELGLSYLDHYNDLAEQLQSVDSLVQLNLLRGFFFWLQNVSHEGAFKPWEVTSTKYLGSLTDVALSNHIDIL